MVQAKNNDKKERPNKASLFLLDSSDGISPHAFSFLQREGVYERLSFYLIKKFFELPVE